jgi:murein DD-endopeptidase MepM/ murein hydrolase activator NlpD
MKLLFPFKKYDESSDYSKVDLSKSYLEQINLNILDNSSLSEYLKELSNIQNTPVLYGGYLEERALYNDKTHFQSGSKQRNIHLGVDFWADAGTEIAVPIDGVVHSFANNSNLGNYGPTIILKHDIKGKTLYSLYGHLSLESLRNKEVGQQIDKGSVFASLGEEKINVGYVPHLHFQLIRDIEQYSGDYPGVCHKDELDFYKKNTINPIPYFNF